METIRVNMNPNPLDVQTIHASQNDGEARQWGFELHNNGEVIDAGGITEQMVFKSYKGGTEQILPENGAVPVTAPFVGDIKYPDAMRNEQEFLYRQSPTEEDGLAKITDIKGNTLVWNQQINTVASKTADGITTSFDSSTGLFSIKNDSRTTNFSSGSNSNALVAHADCVSGHKYLINADKSVNGVTIHTGSQQEYIPTILNYSGTNGFYIRITNAYDFVSVHPVGDVTSFHIYIVDLTKMGLDITDPSDFTSLFSLPYYAYNQGTLLSFNGNGIKTTGKNLIEGRGTGNIYNGGNLVPVKQGDEFWIYADYTTVGTTNLWCGIFSSQDETNKNTYIADMGYFASGTVKKLTASKDGYIGFCYGSGATDYTVNKIMLSFASFTPSEYEPYTSSTLSLPISTYFPTGMKSAGSVYDELTETKAINRLIKTVVDGTSKTANYYGTFQGHQLFYIDLFATTYVNVSNMTNLKSNHYLTAGSATMDDRYIRYQTVAYPNINIGRVYWNDDHYTSASEMNTALQSSPLEIVSLAQSETVETFSVASLVTENIEIPLSNEDGILVGKCNSDVSADAGFIEGKIKLSDEDGDVYSNKIQLHVERSPQ